MFLYKLKDANKLPIEDLRQISNFNRIVMNYLKMREIERRAKEQEKP